jgi:ribonuclease E
VGRAPEEIKWDLDYLLGIWEAIKSAVVSRPAPFLIFQDSNAIIRALRDHLANDIGEIIIDDDRAFEEGRQFIERAMPHNLRKLKQYTDSVPLFTRYQIESQIESAFAHTVELPSGGSIVIDHTEALVSIDINSARATKGDDIEQTAFQTNLEAADEIARQLRLRDLGGLIVIDFIDMGPQRNQREVENRLRDAVRMDRARVQIGRISRFGLLEMSRQRLRPSLGESAHQTCPRCKGMGYIRSVESLALAVLRLVTEEARKDRTAKVIAQLPVDVANFLLNEKREQIRDLETRDGIQLLLVADPALQTPDFILRRVRDDQVALPENTGVSYTLATAVQPKDLEAIEAGPTKPRAEGPAVVSVLPSAPAPAITPEPAEPAAPAVPPPPPPGVFVRLWNWLFAPGSAAPAAATAAASADNRDRRGGERERGPDRGPDRGRDRDRGRGDRDRGRGRNDRQDRGDRAERGARPERAADGGGDRGRNPQQQQRRDERRGSGPERGDQRPPRPERGERPPRPDRPEQRPEARPERSEPSTDAAGVVPVNGGPEGAPGEPRAAGPRGERGRRRRRGGRDRGDRPRDGENASPVNGGAPATDGEAPTTFAEPTRLPDPPADRSAPSLLPPSPSTAVPMPPPTPAAASAPAQPAPPPLPPPVAAVAPPAPPPAPAVAQSAPPAGAGPYIERGTDRLLPWESSPRPDKHVGGEPGDSGPAAG